MADPAVTQEMIDWLGPDALREVTEAERRVVEAAVAVAHPDATVDQALRHLDDLKVAVHDYERVLAAHKRGPREEA